MSIQRFGEKRLRQIRKATGVDWDMVWNRSGSWWLARQIDGGRCRHALINHRPPHEVVEQEYVLHMSTCPESAFKKESA